MDGVYWLASYPKSGNTWLRFILWYCMQQDEPAEIDINAATPGFLVYGSERAAFDEHVGVKASDLTHDEVLAWRPEVLRRVLATGPSFRILKTHDARVLVGNGQELIPSDISTAAIHLVRDPRDVALSLARHLGRSIDETITLMGTPGHRMSASRSHLNKQLCQVWSSWSGHTESWLAPAPYPIKTIRYECMRADPVAVVAGVLDVLGIRCTAARLAAAVAATSLETLRAQEARVGFQERGRSGAFFGDGQVGGWRNRLTPAQQHRIEADHGPVMQALGYL